ncbi:hypothetical protein ACFYT3_01610 [Nocardia amikacinitolerans]|uniref:hypothetical protein n=1 Tax=Nocardia amikacinitolerans TaxID=756689 RepID=UPI003556F2FE
MAVAGLLGARSALRCRVAHGIPRSQPNSTSVRYPRPPVTNVRRRPHRIRFTNAR